MASPLSAAPVRVLCRIGLWVLQILVSWLWLRHFHFGPLEWLW